MLTTFVVILLAAAVGRVLIRRRANNGHRPPGGHTRNHDAAGRRNLIPHLLGAGRGDHNDVGTTTFEHVIASRHTEFGRLRVDTHVWLRLPPDTAKRFQSSEYLEEFRVTLEQKVNRWLAWTALVERRRFRKVILSVRYRLGSGLAVTTYSADTSFPDFDHAEPSGFTSDPTSAQGDQWWRDGPAHAEPDWVPPTNHQPEGSHE